MMSDRVLISAVEALEQVKGRGEEGRGVEVVGSVIWC